MKNVQFHAAGRFGARWRGSRWTALVLLSWCHLSGVSGVTANGSLLPVDPEVRRAVDRGVARVMVELRLPRGFRPEGELVTPDGVGRQRDAIAAAQMTVLSRLPGGHFSLIRRYDSVPFLALEIDADALTALGAMGDVVTRVLPDQTFAPATRQ